MEHILKMELIDWINFLLAVVGVLVIMGATNKMDRSTEKTIILAFATVGAGLVGYGAGFFWPGQWTRSCDSLLLGGLAALLTGSRKRTVWMKPEWMPRLSFVLSGLAWLMFFTFI